MHHQNMETSVGSELYISSFLRKAALSINLVNLDIGMEYTGSQMHIHYLYCDLKIQQACIYETKTNKQKPNLSNKPQPQFWWHSPQLSLSRKKPFTVLP